MIRFYYGYKRMYILLYIYLYRYVYVLETFIFLLVISAPSFWYELNVKYLVNEIEAFEKSKLKSIRRY